MKLPLSLAQLEAHQQRFQKARKETVDIPSKISTEIEQFLQQIIKENDFCMCVPLSVLPSLISSGVFKTQMELDRGRTMGGKEARQKVTQALFGCDTQKLKPSDYPKYGMLMEKDKLRQLMIDSDSPFHYGNVVITFKKQHLLATTTMCVGTSLDFGEYERKCPTFVTNPKYTCLRCENNPQKLLTFYQHILNKDLRTDMPASLIRVYDGILGYEFYELQFHGRLSFFKDVERVELYPMLIEDEEVFARLYPSLDKLNIEHDILSL